MSSLEDHAQVEAAAALSRFRHQFYNSLTRRADALFDLTEAVLCADGPVTSLAELSLSAAFRRGHGALYDALAAGQIAVQGVRDALVQAVPSGAPLLFAVDVTPYPRPDAECSADRAHCYATCRCDGSRKTIPGWNYSWILGLEWGGSSWTAPVDTRRPTCDDDLVTVTAAQIRALVARLRAAGRCGGPGQPVPMMILDCGYPAPALADALVGVQAQLLVRLGDEGRRVFYATPRHASPDNSAGLPGTGPGSSWPTRQPGRSRPGAPDPRFWPLRPGGGARLVGAAPKLETRGHFSGRTRPEVITGTVIQVVVERLPDGRVPHKTLWLRWSGPPGMLADLDVVWRAYLRRFDAEHTFRFAKGTLGWTAARVRTPAQADRWTWLVVAAYTQLRLAVPLARDLRRPWERPPDPARPLSPYRVRRGFRHIRDQLGVPARGPKPSRPGPGRPKGSHRGPARRYPAGKQSDKTATPTTTRKRRSG